VVRSGSVVWILSTLHYTPSSQIARAQTEALGLARKQQLLVG